MPLLQGGTLPDAGLVLALPALRQPGRRARRGHPRGDWKLIEWFEDNRVELYNLRDDLGEQNDLAAQMPDKVAELRPEAAPVAQRSGSSDAHADPNRK